MKPTKEDRKKFDLDLTYGSIREDRIAEMLTNKKIEVKSERDIWVGTNNICIEYESWGKPLVFVLLNQIIGFTTFVLGMKNTVP